MLSCGTLKWISLAGHCRTWCGWGCQRPWTSHCSPSLHPRSQLCLLKTCIVFSSGHFTVVLSTVWRGSSLKACFLFCVSSFLPSLFSSTWAILSALFILLLHPEVSRDAIKQLNTVSSFSHNFLKPLHVKKQRERNRWRICWACS